ncbi:cobalt-precorrin-6A reductase [Roseovarius sp. 2305UL8-3]|uniref:cobalt-precorrin-6A reductase n=1 Tax=Roseovarius conchicola TaxID=3121636 RepID=UPI003528A464
MTLLLLAGTLEAREIAKALAVKGVAVVASLSGGAREVGPLAVPTRLGGFGGETGFRDYLREENITAVLDATHPFAERITLRTERICVDLGLPYCQVLRPPWVPEPGDSWVTLAREEDAVHHIPEGSTVFMTTGRDTLERFGNLTGRHLIVRRLDPAARPFPLPNGEFLVGTPPFSVEEEKELFQRLGVDWLVVKNAGGEAPRSKLIAARELGLPVAVLARPPSSDGSRVETVAEALEWVAKL